MLVCQRQRVVVSTAAARVWLWALGAYFKALVMFWLTASLSCRSLYPGHLHPQTQLGRVVCR